MPKNKGGGGGKGGGKGGKGAEGGGDEGKSAKGGNAVKVYILFSLGPNYSNSLLGLN